MWCGVAVRQEVECDLLAVAVLCCFFIDWVPKLDTARGVASVLEEKLAPRYLERII